MTVVTRLRRPALVSGNSTLPEMSRLPARLYLTPAVPSSSVRLPDRGASASKETDLQTAPKNPAHPGAAPGEKEASVGALYSKVWLARSRRPAPRSVRPTTSPITVNLGFATNSTPPV